MREVIVSDLVGKTIESFDNQAVNVLKLKFTDGAELELWAEDSVRTQFGNIPGILVNDGPSEPLPKPCSECSHAHTDAAACHESQSS